MVTHLRVLSESFQMNTNMTGFRWFSKIFESLWMKLALSIGRVKILRYPLVFQKSLDGFRKSLRPCALDEISLKHWKG